MDGKLDQDIYGIFSQIGSAWLELKKLDSALFYAQQGYNSFLQSNNKIRGNLVFNVLGDVYVKMGNNRLAKNHYRTAIANSMEIQANYSLARSYLGLAALFREEGQKDSCIFYAQKSLQLSRDYNLASYAIKGYEFLTEMYEMQKEPDSTLKYMKLMVAQKDTVFSQAKVQQYEMLLFDEDQRQQQLKEAKVAYTNKIKTYVLLAMLIKG
jgi:tetratricopeptide (TPR) repeat protein